MFNNLSNINYDKKKPYNFRAKVTRLNYTRELTITYCQFCRSDFHKDSRHLFLRQDSLAAFYDL